MSTTTAPTLRASLSRSGRFACCGWRAAPKGPCPQAKSPRTTPTTAASTTATATTAPTTTTATTAASPTSKTSPDGDDNNDPPDLPEDEPDADPSDKCEQDDQCAQGELCVDGNCVAGDCRQDADCPSLGETCADLRCTPTRPPEIQRFELDAEVGLAGEERLLSWAVAWADALEIVADPADAAPRPRRARGRGPRRPHAGRPLDPARLQRRWHRRARPRLGRDRPA
jgi:hypothetical protein